MTPELATRLAELKSQLDGVDDSAATLVLKSDLAALVAEVEKGQAAIEFVRTYARERKAGPLAAVARQARALVSQWNE